MKHPSTPRLLLRELQPEDAEAFFDMDSDPEVHRYLGNQPVKDIQRIREMIASVRKQYITNGIGRWAMVGLRPAQAPGIFLLNNCLGQDSN